jgi:hypothetical protein
MTHVTGNLKTTNYSFLIKVRIHPARNHLLSVIILLTIIHVIKVLVPAIIQLVLDMRSLFTCSSGCSTRCDRSYGFLRNILDQRHESNNFMVPIER